MPQGGLPASWVIDWGVDVERPTGTTAQAVWSEGRPTSTTAQACLRFELRPAPSGQVGLFPEQSENWRWIEARVADAGRPLKVLNLFAYTGGSTLAAAVAGAEVVHVDGSNSVVSWARRNAELTGLTDAPIRWIVEDVRKFVQREIRRGSTYDALILDPPSYGHGPKGESWKLEQDLEPLLSDCARLTANRLAFVLVTCHTSGVGPTALRAQMRRAFSGVGRTDVFAGLLRLAMADGRCLPSGIVARWP